MRIHIIAVGRMKNGPEKLLLSDYSGRFDKLARSFGLGPLTITEVEAKRKKGKSAEAELIRAALPPSSYVMVLDERGKNITSTDFAHTLRHLSSEGTQTLTLVIGGADGLDPSLVNSADASLSFGKMVWPHMLVRVMLCEQLYRSASILAGTPYHRE